MNLIFTLKKLLIKISYLISPPYCSYCRTSLNLRIVFCNNCFEKIIPITSTSINIKNYDINVYAISDYKEPLKTLILSKKISNILASKQLGQLIWQMTNIRNLDFDYVIPIPLHWTREIYRGYNQVQVIADIICKESNKPLINILKRKKLTKFQFNLNKEERAKNLKNAFVLKKDNENFYDKHLLIVDDLFTTGSTLNSAITELIKLKPKKISVVVACRVI